MTCENKDPIFFSKAKIRKYIALHRQALNEAERRDLNAFFYDIFPDRVDGLTSEEHRDQVDILRMELREKRMPYIEYFEE